MARYYQIRIKSSVLNVAVENGSMDLIDQMPDEGLPTMLTVWGTLADWHDEFLPFVEDEPGYEIAVEQVLLNGDNWMRRRVSPREIG